jgi:hypothetical protein
VAGGVATGKEDAGCCPVMPIGRVDTMEEVPRGTVAEAEVDAMKRGGRSARVLRWRRRKRIRSGARL